jgi:hypothetical protein
MSRVDATPRADGTRTRLGGGHGEEDLSRAETTMGELEGSRARFRLILGIVSAVCLLLQPSSLEGGRKSGRDVLCYLSCLRPHAPYSRDCIR